MPECQHNRKPLSGAQAGIWFAQQLDPENPIYNTAEYVEIKGPLDQELFEKALRHVIKEAESFHARFGEDQDGDHGKRSFRQQIFRYITLMSAQKPIRNRRLKAG